MARGNGSGNESQKNHVAETLGEYNVKRKIDIPEDYDELDEELSAEEYELLSDQIMDQATAAETIPELEAEIPDLEKTWNIRQKVVESGTFFQKWEQLSSLLPDQPRNVHSRR